jgi:hypothetical protein
MKTGDGQRKKILKLQVDNEIRFSLIGISSHENDYRLVWAINNLLDFSFSRIDDLVVHQAKTGTDLEFSRYIYTDEDTGITYSLISNRCDNGFLFAEIRNLDFLVKMNGEINNKGILDLVKKLKASEVISACYKLDPLKIKGIQGILQE